jgi:hypothetical protein
MYLQDSMSVVETTKLVNPLNLFDFTKQPKRYFFFYMVRWMALKWANELVFQLDHVY